jgi:SsrA-binding protein
MSSSVTNKKAAFNYFLKDRLEAGIALTGGEVKSAREGSVRMDDAYVRISNGEATIVNLYIAPYKFALDPSYDPKRERKLLLNKNEIEHLVGKLGQKGLISQSETRQSALTIVPTKVYTTHNLIKVEIALGLPKKKLDKRDDLKKKAIQRETEETLRANKINARKTSD